MPYVDRETRALVDAELNALIDIILDHPDLKRDGLLNYCITRLITADNGRKSGYYHFNRKIGILECAKQELYRRLISKYEDTKCQLNGEVYE